MGSLVRAGVEITYLNIQCISTLQTMKNFLLLLFAAAIHSMPQKSREDVENEAIERKAHPSLITNCIAENSEKGFDQIRKCLKCFETSGDPLSEEGLPKAKACTSKFLPRVNTDCAEELEALEPDDEEMGANALECFAEVSKLIAAEECLARATEDNLVETLIDGVICLKELQQNVTFQILRLFEKEIKKDFERFKKYMEKKKPAVPEKDPMKEQMMSLISKRHCQIASNTPEEKTDCLDCFESTRPTESQLLNKSEYVKSLATCSALHLSPLYDQCTELMMEMSKDPEKNSQRMGEGIFLCYMRVVTGNLVEQCSVGMTIASPKNLLSVMECGSYTVFEWLQQNIKFPQLSNFEGENLALEEGLINEI